MVHNIIKRKDVTTIGDLDHVIMAHQLARRNRIQLTILPCGKFILSQYHTCDATSPLNAPLLVAQLHWRMPRAVPATCLTVGTSKSWYRQNIGTLQQWPRTCG